MIGGEGPGSRYPLVGVLLTFRRADALSRMLDELTAQTRPLDWLYVVDNDPTRENEYRVIDHGSVNPGVTYIPASINLGSAGGWALGMSRAIQEWAGRCAWLALADDDDPPWSRTLLSDMESFAHRMLEIDPRVGQVGLGGARMNLRTGRAVRLSDDELVGAVPVHMIGTGTWPLFRVDVLKEVGPLLGPLFFGFSEIEMGMRLQRSGYNQYCNGPLRFERRRDIGRLGMTVRPHIRRTGTPWRRYYRLRNLIWILRTYGYPLAAARVTLLVGIAKPIVGVMTWAPNRWINLRMAIRASIDAWTGRLGRRVDPPTLYPPKKMPRALVQQHHGPSCLEAGGSLDGPGNSRS